jgi:tetratricopeptide (TPR) repeat protein
MRAGLKIFLQQDAWEGAGASASNLSGLELTLGEVTPAVSDAEYSVNYAERTENFFLQRVNHSMLADAQHQAGRRAESEANFRKAEALQHEDQPQFPLLYSVSGFHYCELLLAALERAAWQQVLNSPVEIRKGELLETCREVEQRSKTMFEWRRTDDSLLTIALDHLTLGRAVFYSSILNESLGENRLPAIENLKAAVDALRRAGAQHWIPAGLLSRSWMHFGESEVDSALSDLDQAWEIAERGPMRLHMADIHLYRARLFHGVKPYPWTSPQEDLAAARKLIEKCGYWRRNEELEDAEAAAKNW